MDRMIRDKFKSYNNILELYLLIITICIIINFVNNDGEKKFILFIYCINICLGYTQ